MDKMQKFAERLSELLTERNMRPAHLAKELGVTNKVISRYVNGERIPDLRMAIRLSEYFQCSIDFLLGRSDEGIGYKPKAVISFKERLPYLMEFFHVTKYRLAKETPINESVIYDWQNGLYSPSLDSIIILADYFECTVEFIIGRED